jgi:N-acetylmuramoyl-L-alanine amidase
VTTISEYRNCSTSGVKQLDLQLIAQIQKLAPGILVSFADLPVNLGAGCHPYLQAPAVAALEKAIALRGVRMTINSAYRTLAQQAILYAHQLNRRCGIRAAAAPGKSNHNTALAIDCEDAMGWRPYLERHEWDWIGSFDPMHFDYEGRGVVDMRHLSTLAFQKLWNLNKRSAKLAEDGVWGAATQQALMQTLVTGFGIADSISPSKATTTLPDASRAKIASLRYGDEGADVLALQTALKKQGMNVVCDGDFGKSTFAVVKLFQLQNGLVDDGVVGMATRKALGL